MAIRVLRLRTTSFYYRSRRREKASSHQAAGVIARPSIMEILWSGSRNTIQHGTVRMYRRGEGRKDIQYFCQVYRDYFGSQQGRERKNHPDYVSGVFFLFQIHFTGGTELQTSLFVRRYGFFFCLVKDVRELAMEFLCNKSM